MRTKNKEEGLFPASTKYGLRKEPVIKFFEGVWEKESA
jgi:hypothetical protein